MSNKIGNILGSLLLVLTLGLIVLHFVQELGG
jgi:hypothetical protein